MMSLLSRPAVLVALGLVACGGQNGDPSVLAPTAGTADAPEAARTRPSTPLDGTRWRLVEFQSMDDSQGITRPEDSSLYTLELGADGRAAMRLNCNRANGAWAAEPGADGTTGTFELGPLAVTRALCPPPSLDQRIARDAEYVRGYMLRDGRLHLSLMADGGIYVWAPDDGGTVAFSTTSDATLEAAILDASPDYRKDIAGDSVARYVYSRFDLNADGVDEVFVYMLGPMFCGSGGCNLQIFTPSAAGYSLVGDFSITRTPVIVTTEQTAGWRDIWRLRSGGGAAANYIAGRFDGRTYADGEEIAADTAPAGTAVLTGELSFELGIPLPPRE